MLPYPLTPHSSCSLLITDTAEQSCQFFLPDDAISLNRRIMTRQPISVEAGRTCHLQRDLLSGLQLSRILYHADMAIHVAPEGSCRNSPSTCLVQWWKKSRSGKVDHGEGRLSKLANGQLTYTADKRDRPAAATTAAAPSSTFNLFMTEKQSGQRAAVALPHFKAQDEGHNPGRNQGRNTGRSHATDAGQPPGFDSDDPDADLEI